MNTVYTVLDASGLETPALLYYPDMVEENTRKAIAIAGAADRLWPHVKTHKMPAIVRLQMDMGIHRFKCATIAEAEMIASCGAGDVLVAYPLVGPSIERFVRLAGLYEKTRFWAIGDDLEQLRLLGEEAQKKGMTIPLLVDVDAGMHRTGVPLGELDRFYRGAAAVPGLELRGVHCYDGHIHDADLAERNRRVGEYLPRLQEILEAQRRSGLRCDTVVAGGSPTFPCHAAAADAFLSPGTIFVQDHSYQSSYREMSFTPAAAVATRVISRTASNSFTVDLGYKGIAADPHGVRGVIAGMPGVEPVGQSEEHWVFRTKDGGGQPSPAIGDVLYVIPTHICPTTALYPSAWTVRDGKLTGQWEVAARNRKLSI